MHIQNYKKSYAEVISVKKLPCMAIFRITHNIIHKLMDKNVKSSYLKAFRHRRSGSVARDINIKQFYELKTLKILFGGYEDYIGWNPLRTGDVHKI